MRSEIRLFGYLVPFFVVATVIYAYFTNPIEWVGVVGMALTGLFCAFIAWYVWFTARSIDERPEDKLEGEIDEFSGVYGHFSPYSWWPLWLGLSISVVTLGVGVGWWIVVCAAPFLVVSIVGWTFEYFRGEKAV